MMSKEKETQVQEQPNEEKNEVQDNRQEISELEKQVQKLSDDLEKVQKELEDTKNKSNQILSTASYYKNEAESAKKDFDRYKERNKNIESDALSKANESVAKKLLPILDNFDQAIKTTSEETMKGFSMILGMLKQVIAELGVVEIIPETEDLNPEEHNCIQTEETDDETLDGKVASVYQKGYKFAESNKVIRPATVSVYKKA